MSEVVIDEARLRDEIEKALKERLEEMGLLDEWVVVADAPYAAYVEFGTRPADHTKRGPMGVKNPKITLTREKFRDWAAARGYSEAYADKVYSMVMEHGAMPNPFMRPALYRTLDILDVEAEWDTFPPTVEDVAKRIAENAKRYVEDYSSAVNEAGEPREGTLAESIRAMPASECTIEGTKDPSYTDKNLWKKENMNMGIEGRQARRPRYR